MRTGEIIELNKAIINQHKGTATRTIVQCSHSNFDSQPQQQVKLQSNIGIQQATVLAALAKCSQC